MTTREAHLDTVKPLWPTIVDALRSRAASSPTRLAFIFLDDEGRETQSVTWGELDRQARSLAADLQQENEQARVLLLYPPGLDYVLGLLGCFYAGAIPVPAYPPWQNKQSDRLAAIVADAAVSVTLCTSRVASRIRKQLGGSDLLRSLTLVETDTRQTDLSPLWIPPRLTETSVALLQYTSGSTAIPRGVIVTHGNLMHNERLIHDAFGLTEESSAVSWLPLYHDMGLIGSVLQTVNTGFRCVLLSPFTFARNPFRWLEAITRYRACVSGGPNFAYEHCVQRVTTEQKSRLDLGSWQLAFGGAEPIRAETWERFVEAFAPCGFRKEACYPSYGLAEATLFVTGGTLLAGHNVYRVDTASLRQNVITQAEPGSPDTQLLVGCGYVPPSQRVLIVDPESREPCLAGRIGEIWVAGPSVAQGYWHRPEESRQQFEAYTVNGAGPFLRTGDLGCFIGDELVVTGRIKDLIIIRGANYYPQDIEDTAQRSHPALRAGAASAFSVDFGGSEHLVVAQEVQRQFLRNLDIKTVVSAIRQSVAETHELQLHAVVLLKTDSLPKTSSGKIARQTCRERFLAGTLEIVGEWQHTTAFALADAPSLGLAQLAPATRRPLGSQESIQRWLTAVVSQQLRMSEEEIDINVAVTRYGVDSLMAVELAHQIETELGVNLPMVKVLEGDSISELALCIGRLLPNRDEFLVDSVSPLFTPDHLASPTRPLAERPPNAPWYEQTGTPPQWFPLSYGQRSLWYIYQVAPQNVAYNIFYVARLCDDVDGIVLRRAFEALHRRHAVLRTTYTIHDREPAQRVDDDQQLSFHVVDATHWSSADLNAWLAREADRPFNLEHGPMLRIHLLTRCPAQSEAETRGPVLVMTTHHIVMDLWSLEVLLDELGQFYTALVTDGSTSFPPLALEYRDYVQWNLRTQCGPKGDAHWEYWRGQLSGEIRPLDLPTDKPRGLVQTYQGESFTFSLGDPLSTSLRKLSQTSGVTLYTMILAAFQVLLLRYTGQEDIALGSPVAGRTRAEFAGIIGHFVNPIVIRTQLSGNPTFLILLRRTRQTLLEALEHQDYPFSLIVERLQGKRDPGRAPLFQIGFVWDQTRRRKGTPPRFGETTNLIVTPMVAEQRGADVDLTLTIIDTGDSLTGSWTYNTDLFDITSIRRMDVHLRTLLEGIVLNPEERLSDLPLLADTEHQWLLAERNNTRTDFPHSVLLHELFEAQVMRTPDAIAVVQGDQALSYLQLNALAVEVSGRLRSVGVSSDHIVAIFMDRSPEMVIGLLGILKAGAAYLPLDLDLPMDRLHEIISDCQPTAVLMQRHLRQAWSCSGIPVMDIDQDEEEIRDYQLADSTPLRAFPENLAYVIYTSGSTGRPKGVQVSHKALVNHSLAAVARYDLSCTDQVLQFAAPCFDVAAEEIFPTLTSGATVTLRSEEMISTASDFWRQCRDLEITVLNLPTAWWHYLVSELQRGWNEVPTCLRLVVIGGETADPQLVKAWHTNVGSRVTLLNAYGTTEATITSTCYHLSATEQSFSNNTQVPIGQPLPNVRAYILDQYLQLQPPGVPGELYLAGEGLARGYTGLAGLTATAFLPEPFGGETGTRMYKTGDHARYNTSGEITFLGRVDRQVKLRGYRIEPDEIEIALRSHSQVREAAVEPYPREAAVADTLVGYVVPQTGSVLTFGSLREHLIARLPAYMVPASFVFLDKLPLTPTGKVDRKQLPVPDAAHPSLDAAYVAPRNATEATLANIWSETLHVERVGVYDNFFELGGDSILSIEVAGRASRTGLQLKPSQLFHAQTIAALAEICVTTKKVEAEQGSVTGSVLLSPMQRWFFEQEIEEEHHWNQAVLLQVSQQLPTVMIERALQALLRQHDALRMRFVRESTGWQQYGTESAAISLESKDLSHLSEKHQREVFQVETNQLQAGLSLTEGRLVRAALFTLDSVPHRLLLLVIHHLVVDGVSWRILLEDLQTACRQQLCGDPVQLGPKTTSFHRWSALSHEHVQAGGCDNELPHWQALMHQQVARLPVDSNRGTNTVASTDTVTMMLDEGRTQALLKEVGKAYRTVVPEVLLTALAQSISQWVGSRTVLVELEGHGREEVNEAADLSRTVGWFTAAYPVLLQVEEQSEPGHALRTIKEQMRKVPNRGVGFGMLRYLSPHPEIREHMRGLPKPEVILNYLGQANAASSTNELFLLTAENPGSIYSPKGLRSHLLEINGWVDKGCLTLKWNYSVNRHDRHTIETLAQDFLQTLQALIDHCCTPGVGRYTPSDFPLAELDQKTLDRLFQSVGDLEDLYPLSPMQQGMLFHSLYEPEGTVYFEQLSFVIHGELDDVAFEHAWQQVVARHPVLRTSVVVYGDASQLQCVQRYVQVPLVRYDWRELAGVDETEQHLQAFFEADREHRFAIDKAPLMRIVLIALPAGRWRFVWSFHHLLLDGWSVPLVLREVFSAYEELRVRQPLSWQPPRRYAEYVAWIRQSDRSAAEQFWRTYLADFTAATPLPLMKLRPGTGTPLTRSRTARFDLSSNLATVLRRMTRQHHVTVSTVVAGAWALLLSHYSGERDIVFGVTSSGRSAALDGVEQIVGVCINTLPLRVRVLSETQIALWLQDLQSQYAELRRYEASALVDIHQSSDISPGNSLFDSILVVENYPVDEALRALSPSLEIHDVRSFEQTNYPLTLVLLPGDALSFRLLYDPQMFDAAAIDRILSHLESLLQSMVAEPEQRLGAVSMLSTHERHQVLYQWNATTREFADSQCVNQIFEEQVVRVPNAIAVIFKEEQQLSYAMLNARANQLAHHLRFLRVGPDVRVGVCLERSTDMIVGMLGILKAGGAYVPLDPSYPANRLAFLLQDSGISILLTHSGVREQLPLDSPIVISLDTDWSAIALWPTTTPRNIAAPENLAYVIYTSGSTGVPKGVEVAHQALVNLCNWHRRSFAVSAEARATQLASLAFDAAVWEIWPYLMVGASLSLVAPDVVMAPEQLIVTLTRQEITHCFAPTPLAERLFSLPWPASSPLRMLFTGGDRLTQMTPAELPFAVINNYGPTEAAVVTTSGEDLRLEQSGGPPTIGRPIDNVQIYVLDPDGEPVPIGAVGELHIGGQGLARGYGRRPSLTAARFVPSPYASNPGARLYRTGDLVRYRSDGNVEFVGRGDQQLKIRGYRIESGEIEAVLGEYPTVRQTVVTGVEVTPKGEIRLVAYVGAEPGTTPTASELRQHLKSRLPAYMVPTIFVVLPALPVTSNGKIDRKALPAIDMTRVGSEQTYSAPRTQNEIVLAKIWAELLGVDRVGVFDDFFALGGHSLLATQLMVHIHEALGVELPLRMIFELPSVAQLGEAIETIQWAVISNDNKSTLRETESEEFEL